jgi:hypothetical protein
VVSRAWASRARARVGRQAERVSGRTECGRVELGATGFGKVKENDEMEPAYTNPRYNLIILIELDMIAD